MLSIWTFFLVAFTAVVASLAVASIYAFNFNGRNSPNSYASSVLNSRVANAIEEVPDWTDPSTAPTVSSLQAFQSSYVAFAEAQQTPPSKAVTTSDEGLVFGYKSKLGLLHVGNYVWLFPTTGDFILQYDITNDLNRRDLNMTTLPVRNNPAYSFTGFDSAILVAPNTIVCTTTGGTPPFIMKIANADAALQPPPASDPHPDLTLIDRSAYPDDNSGTVDLTYHGLLLQDFDSANYWAIPNSASASDFNIYKINSATDQIITADTITTASSLFTKFDTIGAVMGLDGNIWLNRGGDASKVFKIPRDNSPGTSVDISNPTVATGTFISLSSWKNVVLGLDGKIWLCPGTTTHMLSVDPYSDPPAVTGVDLTEPSVRALTLTGTQPTTPISIYTPAAEIVDVIVGPDGHIWTVPGAEGTHILEIDPTTHTIVGAIDNPVPATGFGGGGLDKNGGLWFSPDGGTDRARRIQAYNAPQPDGINPNFIYSSFFNNPNA